MRPSIACTSICALLLLPVDAARPQVAAVGGVIVTALAGRTVKSIIDDLRQTARGLLDQGTTAGHAMLTRAGNEGNVLAANAAFQLQGVMDKTFDKLNSQQKALLVETEKFRRDLKAIKPAVYDIKDTTVLDLNRFVQRIPFVDDTLFIQAVRGIAYLPQDGDFTMSVYAPIGVEADGETKVELFLDNRAVPLKALDMSSQRGVAKLTIANGVIAPRFQQRSLSTVPLTIKLTVTRNDGWWVFKKQKTLSLSAPIALTLYPRIAGTATVSAKLPTYVWNDIGTKDQTYQTPDRHCDKKCGGERTRGPNRIEFSVPGGAPPYQVGYQRLTDARLDCIGNPCAYSAVTAVGITDHDTRAYANWDTWSRPSTWRLRAKILQYAVSTEKDATPVTIDLEFDKLASAVLPKARNYTAVDVTTFTGKRYQILADQADALLEYKGESDAGISPITSEELERITWRIVPPDL